jgi:serine protease inhibitor
MQDSGLKRVLKAGLGTGLIACLSALLWECSDKSVDPSEGIARELTKVESQLVTSGNSFGIGLFKAVSGDQPDSNVFISPLSVAMALGMTYNGADGATKDAMENTLELAGLSLEEVNSSYQSLITLLTKLDSRVKFQIANSIWYRLGLEVEQDFLDVNRTYFDAEAEALDFSSPDATRVINDWVSEKTSGKIKTIVSAIPGDAVMYLINAIYFKGAWTYRFDPDRTVDGQFYRKDGSTVPCRLMNLTTEFDYLSTESCIGVDLPYGNEKFSMTVLMPRAGTDIDSLIAGITQAKWDEWMGGSAKSEIKVFLPKFKLEYEKRLNEVLSDLGMAIAFSPGADFTRIRQSGGLWIDEVKHKTFIEVNEEGTEAAAVTSVSIFDSMPPSISFDHPFLYVIRERHSGTILFIGKMMDLPSGA